MMSSCKSKLCLHVGLCLVFGMHFDTIVSVLSIWLKPLKGVRLHGGFLEGDAPL